MISGYDFNQWHWKGWIADYFFLSGQSVNPEAFIEDTGDDAKPKPFDGSFGGHKTFWLSENIHNGIDASGNGNNLTKTGTITQATISPAIGE